MRLCGGCGQQACSSTYICADLASHAADYLDGPLHVSNSLCLSSASCAALAETLAVQSSVKSGSVYAVIDVRVHVQVQIVDAEAANPGYGRFQLIPDANHVDVCKPPHRKHLSYQLTRSFISDLMQQQADIKVIDDSEAGSMT